MLSSGIFEQVLQLAWQHYAAVAIAALVIYVCTPSAQERAVAHLPKPTSTLPFLGNTLDFVATHRERLHTWIANECTRHGGKPWVARVLGRAPIVLIYTEQGMQDVLKTQFDIFEKEHQFFLALEDVFGDGLTIVNGAKWHHQRKVASNLFTMNMLRDKMSHVIASASMQVCDILGKAADSGETVEFKYLMELFTNDVFAKVGFGVDLNYLKQDNHQFFTRVNRVSEILRERTMGAPGIWKVKRALDLGSEKQHKEDMAWIDQFVYGVIKESIAKKQQQQQQQQSDSSESSTAGRDLVSLFLESASKDDDSVESQQEQMKSLRDMVMVFLFAGRTTTANTMSWLIVMLAQNPRVQDKIRAELREKLPDLVSGKIQVPTKEQLAELTYLEATIRENTRLNPVVPLSMRVASQDTTLSDGTFLKKGTTVWLPEYAMGRMHFLWGDDAKEFKPERWIDSETGKLVTVSPFKFFSFGAGPRICLGKNFSFMEMKMSTAALLSKFEFTTERDPHAFEYHATLMLGVGGPLVIRPKRIVPAAF